MKDFIYKETIPKNLSIRLRDKVKTESLQHPDINPLVFSETMGKIFRETAPDTVLKIRKMALDESPVIQIKQLTLESKTPESPYNGIVFFKNVKRTVANMYKVINAMGMESVFYPDEENTLLRAVSPRKDAKKGKEKSSQSPFFKLEWHSDMAYRPVLFHNSYLSPMPDYLVFGVANLGNPYLPIRFIPLESIIEQLSQQDVEVGLLPEFELASPDSVKILMRVNKLPALVRDGKGGFYSRINLSKIKGLTKRAQLFLRNIAKIIKEDNLSISVHFEEGDVIALNNKKTLHTRASFTPNWKGNDRYLVRVYAVRSLELGISENPSKAWRWK